VGVDNWFMSKSYTPNDANLGLFRR
jgi:hypothetical protein